MNKGSIGNHSRESQNIPSQKRQSVKIGIKLKLLGVLLPIVIGVIVLILTQIFTDTRKIILDQSESILTANTSNVVDKVQTWISETLTALKVQRDTIEYSAMNKEQMLAYVKHTANQYDSYPAGIYVATTDGNLIHSSFVPDTNFNVFEKPWYQRGIESNDMILGSAYFDEDSQSYVVWASGVLKDQNGNRIGVAAADIYLNVISEIVSDVKLEETGKLFLMDSETQMIIGHPDTAMVGKKAEELDNSFYTFVLENINSHNIGLTNYKPEKGEEIYIDIQAVPNTNWYTVAYVRQAEILAQLNSLTGRIIAIAIVGCLLLAIFMERIIHMIVKPVKKLSNTLASITEGDFTVQVSVHASDEIGFMADGVSKFITVMRKIIQQINQVSITLNEQAENSQTMSEELSQTASSQSVSMKEMAITISELTASVSEVAENATSLSMFVSDTKDKGELAGKQMQHAVTASDSGREDMQCLITSMSQISHKMDSLEECALQMDGSIDKISSIVTMIREIAEETNLLSLNASIEAARAGAAGKGFAVVAAQIGKLAATSKESVNEIARLTEDISTIAQRTICETKESVSVIKNSSEIVQSTHQAFQQIYHSVNETNTAVKDMVEQIREVSEIAVNVAGITEEQSASFQEILATTEVIKENTDKVTENSKEVEKGAKNTDISAKLLREEMERFRV